VDRLLSSPHYGERWGRHWLDVARYADGDGPDNRPVYIGFGMGKDGYVNTFRYRDWVIQALNDDMPYDQFVKAQIAGDLLDHKEKYIAGLGFYALRPKAEGQEDRVDATTRGFSRHRRAQCHNHKFDPSTTVIMRYSASSPARNRNILALGQLSKGTGRRKRKSGAGGAHS
jgi:hypothetical protein